MTVEVPLPQVAVVPTGDWAATVSAAWADKLRQNPALRMCLPTGSTPAPVYADIVRRGLSWAETSVALLDEWGGIPQDEPGACGATLRRQLLDHVDIPASSYRVINAWTADLADECAAHDAWLDEGLDLAILGVGTNGHLGMNEPGESIGARTHTVSLAPSTTEASVRYFDGRHEPTWGVTVGLRDLLAAGEVWVLATGAHKAGVVRASLEGPVTQQVPASLLRSHPRCIWWLDESAAITIAG